MTNLLVFQSDFGISDGAVSAMYGVALSVNKELKISDITHDIPRLTFGKGPIVCYRLYHIGLTVRFLFQLLIQE